MKIIPNICGSQIIRNLTKNHVHNKKNTQTRQYEHYSTNTIRQQANDHHKLNRHNKSRGHQKPTIRIRNNKLAIVFFLVFV